MTSLCFMLSWMTPQPRGVQNGQNFYIQKLSVKKIFHILYVRYWRTTGIYGWSTLARSLCGDCRRATAPYNVIITCITYVRCGTACHRRLRRRHLWRPSVLDSRRFCSLSWHSAHLTFLCLCTLSYSGPSSVLNTEATLKIHDWLMIDWWFIIILLMHLRIPVPRCFALRCNVVNVTSAHH